MNQELHRGAEDENGIRRAIVYMHEGVPVGVSVVTRYQDIQVFVRKSQRRKGIGLKLVEQMRKELTEKEAARIDAGIGLLSGSREFWEAAKVPLY